MSLKVSEQYNSIIVKFSGKLVGGPLTAELNEILHKKIEEGKKNIVADLSDVSFISSSGMGALISGYTTMKNADGNFVLAGVSDKIEGLLSITKLNQIFKQYDSVEDAVMQDKIV